MSIPDVVEVYQLLSRYAMAVDRRDADAVAECFTEEGVFSSSFTGQTVGREAIRELFRKKAAAGPDGRKHHITNPLVEIDGDTGTFAAYVAGTRPLEEGVEVVFTGRYEGRLARIGGRWYFVERHMVGDNRPKGWA